MARVFSSGFELQSIDSGAKEFIRFSASTGAISTTIKRSGAAALRLNGNATSSSGFGVAQDTHAGATNKKLWLRSYVLFEAFPSNTTAVMAICDVDPTNPNGLPPIANVQIAITSGGQLQFYYNPDPAGFTAVGSASAALNLHQWYRCEIFVDTTTGTSWSGEFRLDGTTISSFSGLNGGGSFACRIIQLSAFPFLGSPPADANGIDQYYDDVAANDANGSFQNSWPGEGKIIHLRPNAAGDNNAWQKQGGGAGDANNYQSVNEINPDDVTNYLKRSTSGGTPIDDYNCDSSASAGLGASDTVKVIQVGVRFGASTGTATARDAKLRIKGQSGGTVQVGSTVFWNSIAWLTHSLAAPASYILTSYTNPQNSAAWTPATLDTMQIGMQPNTASVNEIRVSTLWALVDYVPDPVVVHQGNANLASTGPIIASAILTSVAFANLSATSSLITNIALSQIASAALSGSSDLSANATVYRPASAVLPCTSTGVFDSIPKFFTGTNLTLSSVLSASTKQIWASLATLSGNSDIAANVTRQNFAALASLPLNSNLFFDGKLLYKTVPEAFSITSTLLAIGLQRWKATPSIFVISSDLNANITEQLMAATFSLAASSSLQANTNQIFAGAAVLPITAVFVTPGSATLPAASQIDIQSSLIANTSWRQSAVAILAATSTLAAGSDKYILALSVCAATSSIFANTSRYITAEAVLAGSSNLAAANKVSFAAFAVLPCSSNSSTVATQTIKHQGTAQLDSTSTCIANAQRYINAASTLPLASALDAKFTPLLTPMTAVLSGDTTLTVTTSIKDRAISSSWPATSALLAQAAFLFNAQGSYGLSSNLSSFALQRWNSKANFSLASDIRILPTQKMIESSKWALTSQCVAKTIQFEFVRSNFAILSTLQVNTTVHLVKFHNRTHKKLRGDFEKVKLKAGLEGVP